MGYRVIQNEHPHSPMNPAQLKSSLHAAKPWPFYFLKQSSALKELAASTDPQAAQILVEAVDAKHRLAGKMLPILAATTLPAWIDRLCGIWARQRQDWLGRMILSNKWAGTTPGVDTVCLLKTGQQENLPVDPQSVAAIFHSLTDPDADVQAGVAAYAIRLPDDAPSNDAIYAALVRTKSAALAKTVREQRRVPALINEQTAWWVLKSGLEAGLSTTAQVVSTVLGHVADKDADVQAGVAAYATRLPDDAPSNDAIYAALVRTKSAALAKTVREHRRVPALINEQTAWWVLKSGLEAGLAADAQTMATVLGHVADKDAEVCAGVAAYASRLPDDVPSNDAIYAALIETKSTGLAKIVRDQRRVPGSINDRAAWWVLKSGLQAGLALTVQVMTAVLQVADDKDADVQAGVVSYASRMPDDARSNDALYDAWIRTQSTILRNLITSQQRLPSSVAKETLLRLSMGDADGYLTLNDENGQIFREAWGLAPDALRQLVVRTVTQSGNSRLIDAYTRALGSSSSGGGGADLAITLEARKTAGDEDGLLEACRPLPILDLLAECARWAETGRLPTDPSRKRAVENAIAAWREVGKIEFEGTPTLPDGLVDFFEAELDSSLDSPDPLLRLHAAVNGKGNLEPQQLISSSAWPDRLAVRLLDPALAGAEDHVVWTSLAGGIISNAVFATTAGGTPVERETLLRLLEANAGRTDRAAALNRGLAGVLLAFHSHFQRGDFTDLEDDSAEDTTGTTDGGEAPDEE